MLEDILEPSLGSERAKKVKMSPKEPSQASNNQKPAFAKNLQNTWIFKGFWQQKHLKKASRGRRKLPKGNQKNPTPQKKKNPNLEPKIIKSWNQF